MTFGDRSECILFVALNKYNYFLKHVHKMKNVHKKACV